MPLKQNFTVATFVILLITVGQSSVDTYLPAFPAIAKAFSVSHTQIQLTLAAFLVGIGFSQLIYGPLSDQLGRRPVLIFGLSLFVIASILCSYATSIGALISARLLQGIGAGAPSLLSRVMMRDAFEGPPLIRLASYSIMGWAMIPAIAPLIGGYILEYLGWRIIFLGSAFFGICILFSLYFLLPETRRHHFDKTYKYGFLKNYLLLLKSHHFMGYTITVALLYGIFAAISAISPFLFEDVLLQTPLEYSWTILLIASGFILGSFFNSLAVNRRTINSLIFFGFIALFIFVAIFVILALANVINLWAIGIPLFFIQISLGFIIPNCMAGALQPFSKVAGSAGALFGFFFLTGGAITATITSQVAVDNQKPLAFALLILTTLALINFTSLILFKKT